MIRSVRWQLVFNSVLISLAAIVAVGLVSLLLISAYFEQQERDYLQAQADVFLPAMAQALRENDRDQLRQAIGLASLLNRVRIRVVDINDNVVADSGMRQPISFMDESMLAAPELFFGFVVGPDGSITGFGAPSPLTTGEGRGLLGESGRRSAMPQSPLTAISDTTLEVPLVRGDETVGYIEFSEGPAVGEAITRSISLALAGSGVLALLMAVGVGMLSARQVTRPLVTLGEAANRMAENDLAARAPHSRMREYDRLATQFNQMAGQLSGTIERLETERTVLQRMLADASHELRTPLTALRTFNELLAEEVSAESDAATFVSESRTQIDQLEQMTTNLLDLSRLEARLSGTQFVTVDVRRAVELAVSTLRPLADEKAQQLRTALPQDAVALPHDPAALQQAVTNLLHNAIKYTPSSGQIDISLQIEATNVAIAIQDTGPGIAAADLPHIFDRFYRAPQHETSGTGLGLSIAREIAHIHGGDVTVASTPGAGSTFTLTLPRISALSAE